jgi:type IV pilus assembly protein PilM
MAVLFRGRKKRLVVDLGASAVRVCELSRTKSGYQLTKFYQREFAIDPSVDDETRREIRRKALVDVLREAKIRTRRTIFGVPGQSVFTRTRALPPVPEYKVTQIVKYEIQQQIPFALDQIAMDYQVLDRTEAGGYEVMMAAIKVDVVDKHLDILQSVKRAIDVVDVCPLAAYNWLKHTGEFGDQGECVALIDIGAATTDIVIERQNQFRFTRPLNIGGNDVTQAISSAFNMSFEDAERVKRERGFAPTGDPAKDGKGGEVIGEVMQRMVSEIMRSFAYFRSLPGGGQVNRVVLCGGGACLRNIVPFLQRQLSVDVSIAQPLAGVAVSPGAQQVNEYPEQACVVLGMALRGCQAVPIEINLIPPRVLESARRKEQAFYWALSLTTLALIMASIIPDRANQNQIVQERIKELKSYISMYDPEVAQQVSPLATPTSKYWQSLQSTRSEIQALRNDVNVLENAREQRSFWLDELLLINEARPTNGGVWFSMVESTSISEPDTQRQRQPGGPQRQLGFQQPPSGPQRQMGFQQPPGGQQRQTGFRQQSGVGAGTGMDSQIFSSGFSGIEPRGAMGTRSFEGRSFGFRGDDREPMSQGRGQRGTGDQQQALTIPAANGLTITGFAESDELIKAFIRNLEQSQRILSSGHRIAVKKVHFSESSVERVPFETLYNAPTRVTELRGGGGRQPGYTLTPQQAQTSLFSFRLDIELDRGFAASTPTPPPAPPPPPEGGMPGPPPGNTPPPPGLAMNTDPNNGIAPGSQPAL